MLSGEIRTTGLKVAKPAFIQPKGSGYRPNRPTRQVHMVDHSVDIAVPSVRNNHSSNFSTVIPARYRNRISKDRDLSGLL